MILSIYVYHDSLKGFGEPRLMDNDPVAVRSFAHEVYESSVLQQFGDQFSLCRIGTYDTETGTIVPEAPVNIAVASDFKE